MAEGYDSKRGVIPAQAGIQPEMWGVFGLIPVRTTLRLWRYFEMDPGLRRDDIVGGEGLVVIAGCGVVRAAHALPCPLWIVPIPKLGVSPAEAGIHPEMCGF